MTHRKLIAGNWKMNGSLQANEVLLREVIAGLSPGLCDVAVCVPAPYLAQAQTMALGSALRVGAQDVSAHDQGAFTGEISAAMLRDFGARYAIVGHSERRESRCVLGSLSGSEGQFAFDHRQDVHRHSRVELHATRGRREDIAFEPLADGFDQLGRRGDVVQFAHETPSACQRPSSARKRSYSFSQTRRPMAASS